MSPCTRRIGVAVTLLLAAGLLASAAGLVPIAASSGHWAVTSWLLHFTMRRSVQTRALWSETAPDLSSPAVIMRGAGHYASGCAPCHGAPGETPSGVTRHMTPPPPLLEERIGAWTPPELFWIVRHGVKYTGMPAWPSQQRPDEVWSVVAFLRQLPELQPAAYRWLAFGTRGPADGGLGEQAENGDAGRLRTLSHPLRQSILTCERCHGQGGRGRLPGAFPRIAGLSQPYLTATLKAYAERARHSGIMQPIAFELDAPTREALARHFSRLPPGPATPAPPEQAERGERIARRGVPERKVAACVHCHGPGDGPRSPHYPELAGQDPAYLTQQLQLFIQGRRGGTPWAQIMEISAHRLRPDEAEAVAAYYGGLERAWALQTRMIAAEALQVLRSDPPAIVPKNRTGPEPVRAGQSEPKS